VKPISQKSIAAKIAPENTPEFAPVNRTFIVRCYPFLMQRPPRLAMMTLPTLDHFTADILARLPEASGWEVKKFMVTSPANLAAALAWTDAPSRDAIWFEFCWPPFPAMIEATDFGGRRVIVRVHRIEATETPHVANTAWAKVDDVIVVSPDMRERVLAAAPEIEFTTELHLIPNGIDCDRFIPGHAADPKRIGWAGLMTLRKNPTLALQIFARLYETDPGHRVHMCGMSADPFAIETFAYLSNAMGLTQAIVWDGQLPRDRMPEWHRQNAVLLHTSLHESFGYVVGEAALSGCRVAMLDHAGARDMWPSEILYRSVDEAVSIMTRPASTELSQFVRCRYGMRSFLAAIADMLNHSSAAMARASQNYVFHDLHAP